MDACAQSNQCYLLVGTYTKNCDSTGIYVYTCDIETAQLTLIATTEKIVSPSFLSISKDGKFVYSVNENGDRSMISAFAFDQLNGRIELLNQAESHGASPCYIIDDANHILVANYEGGTIAVFEKAADGSIGGIRQVVVHRGSGPNRDRQKKAHVHTVRFSPDKKYVLANDLGADEVSIYDYSPSTDEVLTLKNQYKMKPGSGPRHLAFSPDGKFVYVLHELDGSLAAFEYHDGALNKIGETTVVGQGFAGEIAGADIHTDENGGFLYATNRGDADTISVFKIGEDGNLTHIETQDTKGKGPRNFAIAPGGKFLLVAHENSNEIVIFSRDEVTGRLADTGKRLSLCAPVCLKFRVRKL